MRSRNINLRYGKDYRTLQIRERNLLGLVEPGPVPPATNPESAISEALDKPIGSPTLDRLATPGQRVTILIDDNTRPTPADILLPPVLDRLLKAGIKPNDITILIAGGTHRPLTEKEILQKVGPEIQSGYKILNHLWMDRDQLVTLEATATGVPVEVNRLVTEADLCIGIGDIAPHPLAGWSGGGKIIEPGVCGEATTSEVHSRLIFHQIYSYVGDENCPMRLDIERVARKAGLRFIVNTVLDAEHKIVGVFAGDLVEAHRAGVAFARRIWTAPIKALADIVIGSSYPADLDFWQAEKSLAFMVRAVKRGGDMILLAPCPEGISEEKNHRQMILKYAGYPSREVHHRAIAAGEWDMAGVNVATHNALARELADVTIVSEGITPADCKAMGFAHTNSIDDALGTALEKQGPDAKILLLPYGPKVVPVLQAQG